MKRTLFSIFLILFLMLTFYLPNTFAQDIRHTVLKGHTGNVYSVVFSPDGSMLASGSADDTIRLWNPETGEHIRTLEGHGGDVNSVVFSPDGSMLASGSVDDTVRLWRHTRISHIRMHRGHTNTVNSVVFSPDGSMLASGSADDTIRLWNPETGEHIRTLTGHTDAVNSVVFSPDGSMLASGSRDDTIRLWNPETGEHIRTLEGHGTQKRTLGIFGQWSAATHGIYSVVFSPDGSMLASGSEDNTVRLWNPETGEHIRTLEGHGGDVNSVVFSPDGSMLASGGSDSTVRLWNPETYEHIRTLKGHTYSVNSVVFSPDGSTLASGSYDNTVLLWDLTPFPTTNATVRLSPAAVSSPAIGEQITFNLNISGGEAVAGYQATVQFDISALRYVLSANGDFLPGDAFFVETVVEDNLVKLNAASLAGETDGDGTLATLTFDVIAAKASTLTLSDVLLTNSAGEAFVPQLENAQITEPTGLKGDVNGDGIINIQDLVLVASNLGKSGQNSADVNGDGLVNIQDLVLVAGALGTSAAAPSLNPQLLSTLTAADIKLWLSQAQLLTLTDATSLRGILFLEQLLAALLPTETVLLPNYPNPFNPETWIPYRLAEDAFVTLTIYNQSGQVVRTLDVGHRSAAFYESRSKAIYWDGRNEFGEQVASGVFFYHLSAGRSGLSVPHRSDYSATRKMLILK